MKYALIPLLLLAGAASAQDSTAPRAGALCFRGFDNTRCRNYIITELSFSQAMFSSTKTLYFGNSIERQADFEQKGHAAVGLARNLSNRQSIGAVTVFDVSQDGNLTGLEARYRRWFGATNNAWELHGGYAREVLETGRPCPAGGPPQIVACNYAAIGHGVRGGAALAIGPYVTVFTRGELLAADGQLRGAWFNGIGGTSHASYISGAAVLALMFAVLSSLGPNY